MTVSNETIPMVQFRLLLPACVATAFLSAQTVTYSNLAPVTAQVTLNGLTQVNNLPAGALANIGSHVAFSAAASEFAIARAEWSVTSQMHGVYSTFSESADAQSVNPVSASLSAGDFLLQVSNPTPVAAQLRLTRSNTPPAGAATRILQVDIGNDGTIDFSESSPSTTLTLPLTVSPVPLLVRIHYQLSIPGPGSIGLSMRVDVEPTAGITATPVVAGCDLGHDLALLPTFGGDLRVQTIGPLLHSNLSVTVFGFTTQPFLLPTPMPTPCLLVPSPHVVLFVPSPGVLVVSLPQAVRPATFWVQGVVLDPVGLTTTTGSRIDAL
jgi:hypothetical protein